MEVVLGPSSSFARAAVESSRGSATKSTGALATRQPRFLSFRCGYRLSDRWPKSDSISRKGLRRWHSHGTRPVTRISATSAPIPADPADAARPTIAPLRLESPVGQFLSQILISHPHLLPAAVEQQLEQLQTDIDKEKNEKQPSLPSTELTLYRRIAEVKANERKRTIEEILYALIVQKFMQVDVSLVPSISQSPNPSSRVDHWPLEENKIKELHSPEAYEMIVNHLQLILGQKLSESEIVAPISKLRVGQVYAASVMYGYFLKRVDERFQLEKRMKSLPFESNTEESGIKRAMSGELGPSSQSKGLHSEVSSWSPPATSPGGFDFGMNSTPLRTYVISFDSETLQKYATIRSKEAFRIVEKHTEALFGKPEIVITPQGIVDSSKDELLKISFSGLKQLILEAVTFGSFLWDVESHVDSRYHFVTS